MGQQFNKGEVIKANRSGQLAVILEVDRDKKQYVYQYIKPTSTNFQGIHRHSFSDIENYWDKAPKEEDSFNLLGEFESFVSDGCDHKWVWYQGLNEKFEYCATCTKKKI